MEKEFKIIFFKNNTHTHTPDNDFKFDKFERI